MSALSNFSHATLPCKPLWQLKTLSAVLVGASVFGLAACGPAPEKVEEARPVRLLTLGSTTQDNQLEFAGEVRPRIESRLGFRVAGKISARLVEIGSAVKKGQALAKLDPQDYALAQSGAQAQVVAAQTDRDLAQADLKRYTDLFSKGFISQAEVERRQAVYKAAQAKLDQAQAAYKGQANQTAYTTLVADADGVVTGLDAEIGQVVAAGQSVVRVARDGEKEIAIALPEGQVDALRRVSAVVVRLPGITSADGQAMQLSGKIREIAPAADSATRTYAAKISLGAVPPTVRLGMTATVVFPEPSGAQGNAVLKVPLTALLQEKGRTVVWVFDKATSTVKPVEVKVGEPVGNDVMIVQGLSRGQTVVTAGAHLLKAGLKVKPLTNQVDLSGLASAAPAANPNAASAAAKP